MAETEQTNDATKPAKPLDEQSTAEIAKAKAKAHDDDRERLAAESE
jgi:hypothetical protein